MLKYKIDILPVSYCVAVFLLQLWGYFYLSGWEVVIFFPLTFPLFCFIAAFNHHQQHFNVFKKRIHNRIFEVILGLQTGILPFEWVYHHNVGHHTNYLNQKPEDNYDEAVWTHKDGSQMTKIYFSCYNFWYRHESIARNLNKLGNVKQRAYFFYKRLHFFIMFLFLLYNPWNAMMCFILPSYAVLLGTIDATYYHHAGLYTKDPYKASRNTTNKFYNIMTCNLGYHTAHHLYPFCHWSKLPELHEKIKDKIPPELIYTSFFVPTPQIVQPPEGYFSDRKTEENKTDVA